MKGPNSLHIMKSVYVPMLVLIQSVCWSESWLVSSESDVLCPYQVCSCDSTIIVCSDRHLDQMPTLKAGTFNQTWLYIDGNNISTITEGDLMPSLTHIDLHNNSLSSLPPAVSHLHNLTQLIASNNHITSIDNTVFPSSLVHLYLGGNLLKRIPDLRYLNNLDTLYVYSNNISESPNDPILLPPSLTELDLQNNSLTSIPASIANLTHLTKLGVSDNEITSIADTDFPSSLIVLNVSGNSLMKIPGLSHLTNLQSLDLSSTHFSNSPADLRFPSSSLSSLDLSNNSLTSVPPTVVNLTQMTWLSVSYNKLTSIDDVVFHNSLANLYANNNKITSIKAVTFLNDTARNNLLELNLSHNPLTTIAREAFQNLKQLNVLDLSNTGLTRLPMALTDLTELDIANLDNIQGLKCTCHEAFLSMWYKRRSDCRYCDFTVTGDCGIVNVGRPTGITTQVSHYLDNVRKYCGIFHA